MSLEKKRVIIRIYCFIYSFEVYTLSDKNIYVKPNGARGNTRVSISEKRMNKNTFELRERRTTKTNVVN